MNSALASIRLALRCGSLLLLRVAVLAVSVAVCAPEASAEHDSGTTALIQRHGQQKQLLIQGLATTQLSQKSAKRLAQGAQSADPKKPVSQADVLLNREERIRRLNAAKTLPAVVP